MSKSGLIIAGAAGAAILTAVLLFRKEDDQAAQGTPATQALVTPASPSNVASRPLDAPAAVDNSRPVLPPAGPPAAAPAVPEDDPTKIVFHADAKGRMVTNEAARLNLEKLYALYTPEERQRQLEELQGTLPPAAARDLADMLERYVNYDAAQRQTFPPGQELASPEEGLNIIDGMHNLRVQYFGAEAANAMFAKEEKIQRELLRLMSLEKDGSLTIEEKAERAQAMYQAQMPETMSEIATGRRDAERIQAQKQALPKTN
jgi:hypothetical protein